MSFRKDGLKAEDLNLKQIISLLSLRKPREVLFEDDAAYPLCPNCNSATVTDYQAYCVCCGQRLDWRHTFYATFFYNQFSYLFKSLNDDLYLRAEYISKAQQLYKASPKARRLLEHITVGVFQDREFIELSEKEIANLFKNIR